MNDTATPVALVTGAARGIGRTIAATFLDEGWQVILLDIDRETLQQTETEFAASNRVYALTLDVSDETAVQSTIDEIFKRFGRIDALVKNAGTAVFKPVLETTGEEWRRVMAVNLDGPFYCTQAAAPKMILGGGGSVVNIASISGVRASLLRVAYGTSKAALIHLTKQQAAELATQGVRVNAVAPGPVDTAMAKAVHTAEIRADYHDAIPLGRYGLEQEIADAVYFLCSDKATYINGQTLAVDGGFDATGIGLATLRRDQDPGSDKD